MTENRPALAGLFLLQCDHMEGRREGPPKQEELKEGSLVRFRDNLTTLQFQLLKDKFDMDGTYRIREIASDEFQDFALLAPLGVTDEEIDAAGTGQFPVQLHWLREAKAS